MDRPERRSPAHGRASRIEQERPHNAHPDLTKGAHGRPDPGELGQAKKAFVVANRRLQSLRSCGLSEALAAVHDAHSAALAAGVSREELAELRDRDRHDRRTDLRRARATGPRCDRCGERRAAPGGGDLCGPCLAGRYQ